MDEKVGLLGRAKAALKAGRDQRKGDLVKAGEEIHEELSTYRGKNGLEHEQRLAPLFDAASARRFLSHVDIEDRYGKETRVENAEVKPKEPYEKRPSVRAVKRARGRYPQM